MTEPAFDPASPDFIADPDPAYAQLFEHSAACDQTNRVPHHPVRYDERTDHWYVSGTPMWTRYCATAGSVGATLHRFSHAEMGRPEEPAYLAPFWTTIRNGMLDRELPNHTRLRRLGSAAFTPRRVQQLRPTIQRLMDALVDEVAVGGSSTCCPASPSHCRSP